MMKVANIPILTDVELPRDIFPSDVPRVGLTIAPERLVEIRKSRLRNLPNYVDPGTIHQELEKSHRIFRQMQVMQIINVTSLPVEEIANRIMENMSTPV
jgi:regulator of PEP synthase PpsR (kinase-PPPase family)